MNTPRAILSTLFSVLAAVTAVPSAEAALQTFVSIYGNDLNSCGPTDPCQTIDHALTQTDPNGDVILMDSGVYDGFFISQSATIVAPEGVEATIRRKADENQWLFTVWVNLSGRGDQVVLRNLKVLGNDPAVYGVVVHAATNDVVVVDDCTVTGAHDGVVHGGEGSALHVKDSILRGNRRGLVASGGTTHLERVVAIGNLASGVTVEPGRRAFVTISNSELRNNDVGLLFVPSGIEARVTVESSIISGNPFLGIGSSIYGESGAGTYKLAVIRSTISGNGMGAYLQTPGSQSAFTQNMIANNDYAGLSVNSGSVVASDNTIIGNGNEGIQVSFGQLLSRGNNAVYGNNSGLVQTLGPITPLAGI